jgi:hypothetical protein
MEAFCTTLKLDGKEKNRITIITQHSLTLDTVFVKCCVVPFLVGYEAKNTQILRTRVPELRSYKVLCVKRDKTKENGQLKKNDRETYKERKQKGQL